MQIFAWGEIYNTTHIAVYFYQAGCICVHSLSAVLPQVLQMLFRPIGEDAQRFLGLSVTLSVSSVEHAFKLQPDLVEAVLHLTLSVWSLLGSSETVARIPRATSSTT